MFEPFQVCKPMKGSGRVMLAGYLRWTAVLLLVLILDVASRLMLACCWLLPAACLLLNLMGLL